LGEGPVWRRGRSWIGVKMWRGLIRSSYGRRREKKMG